MEIKKTYAQIDKEKLVAKVEVLATQLRKENPSASVTSIMEAVAKKVRMTRWGVSRIARRAGFYEQLRKREKTA